MPKNDMEEIYDFAYLPKSICLHSHPDLKDKHIIIDVTRQALCVGVEDYPLVLT